MHVISRKKLRQFSQTHPEAQSALDHWFRVARRADWQSFADVRRTFNTADFFHGKVIFDVGGNRYRIVAAIHYNRQKLYVRQVLTHQEYARGGWQHD